MKVKKVLIVDDEPNIVKAIQYILSGEPVEVYTAADGESGLAKAMEIIPDVLVLDVMMPGLDGFSVAKKIREEEKLANVNILFLTAKGTSQDKMTGYDAGGEIYMVKPFDNDILLEKIRELLKYTKNPMV